MDRTYTLDQLIGAMKDLFEITIEDQSNAFHSQYNSFEDYINKEIM